MFRIIIILAILFICSPVNAELNLKPIHPDEPADYTYNQRFSVQNSLSSLKRINSALDSFRYLTEASRNIISKEEVQKIGNTGWENQNLGFHNWTSSIEGTLFKQEYIIKKLKYELTLQKVEIGQLGKAELDTAEKECKTSRKEISGFVEFFFNRRLKIA